MEVTTDTILSRRFVRPGEVEGVYGIKRGHVYALEKAGMLNLIRIKAPGSRRGIALLDVAQLDALIDDARSKRPECITPIMAGAR